jgi:hypothetical protein
MLLYKNQEKEDDNAAIQELGKEDDGKNGGEEGKSSECINHRMVTTV